MNALQTRKNTIWKEVFGTIVRSLPLPGVLALQHELLCGGKRICRGSIVLPDPLSVGYSYYSLLRPTKACVVGFALWQGLKLGWCHEVIEAYFDFVRQVNRRLRANGLRFDHFVNWFDEHSLQLTCARMSLELDYLIPRLQCLGGSYGSGTYSEARF